jgi:hypothetical protein
LEQIPIRTNFKFKQFRIKQFQKMKKNQNWFCTLNKFQNLKKS